MKKNKVLHSLMVKSFAKTSMYSVDHVRRDERSGKMLSNMYQKHEQQFIARTC